MQYQLPEIVSIPTVRGASYNPRATDPDRLEIVKLSLRKLGWVIPTYATEAGELASGHQRKMAATELGAKRMPIKRLPSVDYDQRRAVNLLFNQATNDMLGSQRTDDLTGRLFAQMEEIVERASAIPDMDLDSDEAFRCVHGIQMVNTMDLVQKNSSRFHVAMWRSAERLRRSVGDMNLVVSASGRVCNGLGRLEDYAARKYLDVPCVVLDEDLAWLAERLTNLLTMDFTVESQYADMLRYNSFRRAQSTKRSVGRAFTFDWSGDRASAKDSDITPEQEATVASWKRHYGESVVDFGAGHQDDTERLRAVGVRVTPFEPYCLAENDTNVIDLARSRKVVMAFLDEIEAGFCWSSIFQNSIMNSVPFRADREKIVTIIAAIADTATVYACAADDTYPGYLMALRDSSSAGHYVRSQLTYESRVLMTIGQKQPKMQKYHTPREWYDLWSTGFEWVNARRLSNSLVGVTARRPKPIDVQRLKEAIEFEFDLPYPGDQRMGLVGRAKEAFSRRLSIEIP